MNGEHGYLGDVIRGFQSYISVHYPKIYADLQNSENDKSDKFKKDVNFILMEYLNHISPNANLINNIEVPKG